MPPAPAASFPGPAALGRGVVVAEGAPTPTGFDGATRVRIDRDVLAHPRAAASVLHHHWLHRRRIVLELAVPNEAVREPEIVDRPPYLLSPDVDLDRERLHALTWANTYDLRSGQPIWWHGILAVRRTSAAAPLDMVGDVVLQDGRAAWVDGGPRGPVPAGPSGAQDLPLVHRESIALGRATVLGDTAPSGATALAADQLAAVTHAAGPARIIAPAGSGKTRVLTARLRHLLADRHVEPELLTAVAYNTRAASELRARTRGLGASIRTLHSLALAICNLDVRRDVIHERDVRGILDTLVRTARVPNQDPYQPYLEALSEVRLALRDPVTVEAARGDVDGFAEMFDDYRRELERRGVLDFDEQVYRAIELLLTRPDIRATARQLGTHLLVDEFQDLTPAFLLLIRLVAGPTAQVFAVGDDDQTIYSYAGATPDYLVDIDRWFPGAEHHALEVNYRCPPAVVDAAATLLSHNRARVPKTIRSGVADDADGVTDDVGAREEPLTVHTVAAGEMSQVAVAIVQERLAVTGDLADIAVLARVNSALLPVQVALTDAGIAHTGPLDATVLGRTGVRTALAYLRLGLDLERIRRDDLLDTINRPARKVKSAVQPLLRSSRLSIAQLEQVADALGPTHRDRFVEYLGDLRSLERAITDGADTAEVLRIIRERVGLGEAMDALDSSRSRPEGSSHADDLDALRQLAVLQPDPGAFREWLADHLKVPGDPTGVTLSTVHKVKGMEWGQVVVFAANGGLFPHRLADDLEEERRVFHVAVTRCRDRVAVIGDRERPSPFLVELHEPATRPACRGATTTEDGPTHPAERTTDGTVVARPGTTVELIGGFTGRIVATDADGAALHLTSTTSAVDPPVSVRLAYGATVVVDDQPAVLARRPPVRRAGRPSPADATSAGAGGLLGAAGSVVDPSSEGDAEVDEQLFEALRGWRARVAADSGVPAYLVFHDRHLRLIAGRKPTSIRDLAGCPGVGPTKLERYGDDVLDVVDRHR